MAEPSGPPKPSDFFIGVIDFFAILVPGVAAAMLFVRPFLPNSPEGMFWVSLLVAGFLLGHVLYGLGSFLDDFVYDPLFKPPDPEDDKSPKISKIQKYLRSNHALYALAKRSTLGDSAQTAAPIKSPPGGMYQWARVWVRLHSAEATAELDRLEADSKLFRSLAVLLVAIIFGWAIVPHFPGGLPLAGAGLVVSLWRYCELRQKMVRSCYLHYLQIGAEPPPPQAATHTASENSTLRNPATSSFAASPSTPACSPAANAPAPAPPPELRS
jgi:hypothetical protein